MFEFEIEKVDFLPAAKIWCLTGRLLSGEIRHRSTAFIETGSGIKKVKIETAAFVDPPDFGKPRRLTLTVQSDGQMLQDYAGKIIASKPRRLATV